jgi:hypothetical protein
MGGGRKHVAFDRSLRPVGVRPTPLHAGGPGLARPAARTGAGKRNRTQPPASQCQSLVRGLSGPRSAAIASRCGCRRTLVYVSRRCVRTSGIGLVGRLSASDRGVVVGRQRLVGHDQGLAYRQFQHERGASESATTRVAQRGVESALRLRFGATPARTLSRAAGSLSGGERCRVSTCTSTGGACTEFAYGVACRRREQGTARRDTGRALCPAWSKGGDRPTA